MSPSSKGAKGKKAEEISDHVLIPRRRLHDALALGIKCSDKKVKRWHCADAEIQLHALKAMSSFVDCVPLALLQHPLIKDSFSEMVISLEGILQSENDRILGLAADVTHKLVSTLGSSVRLYPMLEVVICLSRLLSSSGLPIASSCAISLNRILRSLSSMRGNMHKEVWIALEKANLVSNVVYALQNYGIGRHTLEYFIVMTSLLETILCRWPLSRYQVWSNSKFMDYLAVKFAEAETSISIGVLKLYSAIALCGNGAMKLLENKDLLSLVAESMGKHQPSSIRIESLRLCQHLTRSGNECSMLTSLYCEAIIGGILDAMSGWRSLCSKKVPSSQMPLVLEACRAALITRWAGKHHSCFWKHEIAKTLLDLLLGDCSMNYHAKRVLSSDELVAVIYDNAKDTRPFIWDILGNLSVYCEEDFVPKAKGELCYLDFLISCACSLAADLMQKGCSSLSFYMPELEPVSRAVLLMVFSPCKYIASQSRYYLSETLKTLGGSFLDYIIATLKHAAGLGSLLSDTLHTITNLISLACCSILPTYHRFILERGGVKLLLSIVRSCLTNDLRVNRSNHASHLHISSYGKTCCWNHVVALEGEEIFLLYSLQALSQLIGLSNFLCIHNKLAGGKIIPCENCGDYDAQCLIESLQHILNKNFGPGPRWYSAYILSFFGFYDFPNSLGRNMERSLIENELADVELLLSDGQSLRVHGVILVARCPYLLTHKESHSQEKMLLDKCKALNIEQQGRNLMRRVRISDRVDKYALVKILEYIYTGFIQADDDLVKPLKLLAKCCDLKSLLDMINHRLPKWGLPPPCFSFSEALDPSGYKFSDVMLEARIANEVIWTCSMCQVSEPHVHAHKIILLSRCDYLRALFRSGMHESYSETIKVPVGWKALLKLVKWLYSGCLPTINSDCVWNNLDVEQQFHELEAYVELSSLGEFWCLEELEEQSYGIVVTCLTHRSSLSVIRLAASLSQWKIVTAGISNVAPLYPKLRDDGELDDLSENLVDMLRTEYVRYSFEEEKTSSGCRFE